MDFKKPPGMPSGLSCPIPISEYPSVTMAHGAGGKMTHQLIEKIFMTAFDNPLLKTRHDGAVFQPEPGKLAFTTDSYVVRPLFFPGGDIGSLAVNGTVNDLAMCGARPLYLSAGFILEEGFSIKSLWRIALSMRQAADQAHVFIVTGDTKVVDKGKGDGIFINTAGIGQIEHAENIAPQSVRAGDAILLSGDIGRHGIALLAARAELNFETTLESDCANVSGLVLHLLRAGIPIHCLRDLTRGGLAAAVIEISESAGVAIEISESDIPIRQDVRGACEIIGLDPLHIANEGRFIAFVPQKDADTCLALLKEDPLGQDARIIGHVQHADSCLVTLISKIGGTRLLTLPSGELLPRIC